jgi:hypothetical protein
LIDNQSVAVGSVVNKVDKNRLAPCPFAKPVAVRFDVPFCLCGLESGSYCQSNGKRYRFAFHFDGFRCVWLCDKLVGFPDLER